MIEFVAELLKLMGERPAPKRRASIDDYPGWFAARVRVDDVNG